MLPWEHQKIRRNHDFLYFSVIFGTSHAYLNTAPPKDQHKTFHKSKVDATLLILVLAWCGVEILT